MTDKPAKDQILVDREDAAALLGMGLTSFKEYVQPHVPCFRRGRMRRYRPADLEAFVEANLDRRGKVAA